MIKDFAERRAYQNLDAFASGNAETLSHLSPAHTEPTAAHLYPRCTAELREGSPYCQGLILEGDRPKVSTGGSTE